MRLGKAGAHADRAPFHDNTSPTSMFGKTGPLACNASPQALHGSSTSKTSSTLSARRTRQRHGPNSNPNSRQKASRAGEGSAISRWLQKFDLYAKVDEDLQVKTEAGAAVTIGFWLVMVLLVYGEVAAHLRVTPATERLVVDSTMGQKLRININITFHSIPCLDVHVDAMDVAGENQLDIDHDMFKQRLSPSGQAMGDPFVEVPGEAEKGLLVVDGYCGSCYGANKPKCCNTCKELTDAYSAMGWAVHDIRRTAEQCIRDNHIETPVLVGEGCRLSGFMQVNKVSGNFHVAAGEGVMRNGRHVHQYNLEEAAAFNTSHTIHSLSFGEPYPGMRPNPLDGTNRIIDEDVGTGSFQYFIKLVPTIHSLNVGQQQAAGGLMSGYGGDIITSQFAYTFKFRSLSGYTDYHREHELDAPHHHITHGELQGGGSGKAEVAQATNILPGVFFVYDVSPFMVEVIPGTKKPVSHLLIRLCAVAGGAFAVSGIVNSAVFYISNRLRRRKGLLGAC